MSRFLRFGSWVIVALVPLVFLCAPGVSATPLDDYVATPDANYTWELVGTYKQTGYTDYVISMYSQRWLTEAEVNIPLWHHWLILTVPDHVQYETALLVISGGSIYSSAPTGSDDLAKYLATHTNSVVVTLKQIPNEPLTFVGYRQESEDGLIAYGWRQFLLGGDPKWLMRLPMTKAVVRAMDTVTEFMATPEAGATTIDKFVVAGASKRGWTTWTTAAVDAITNKRVVGMIPMVIDVLNMEPSFRHHFDAYGFWSPEIVDYTENGIMDWLGTPEMKALEAIVDPFSYRDRYVNIPKLIMCGSGDEFFLPDSSQFYYNRLPGEKHMLYVPNAGHPLEDMNGNTRIEAIYGIQGFYTSILNSVARPNMTWYKRSDGSIVIDTHGAVPQEALLYQATQPYRVYAHGVFGDIYESSVLAPTSPGHYVASVTAPDSGWTAFYALFKFASGGEAPFVFSTEISVVPDVLPYGPQYKLGTGTNLLDDNFYTDGGTSTTPVRYALKPSASNKGKHIAFWGVHSQTNKAGLFVVTAGRPSSWQRLAADVATMPDAPIVWTPDDNAIIVGQSKLPIPAAGQTTNFQSFPLHGIASNVLDATAMAAGNYAVAKVHGDIALLPILPNGGEDLSRAPVVVTDLAAAGVEIQDVSISADGTTLAFDDVHPGTVRDTGDVYTLRNLYAIRTAPKRVGTNISTLAPTVLTDDNLSSLRSVESDNFAFLPSLSDDGTMAYFSEDWKNVYRASSPITDLVNTDFDAMVSYSDGTEADTRLKTADSQIFASFTRGGIRALYTQTVGTTARLFTAPLRVTTLASTGVAPFELKSLDVTALQQFDSDGSATLNVPAGVSITFPNGSETISIETPSVPESYGRIPVGVADLPLVRVVAPENATMTGYATLVLKYNDAEIAGLDENQLKVYRLDAAANVYRPVDSPNIVHDKQANLIKIDVNRFGTYAIGGPGNVDDDRDGIPNSWEAFYGLDPYYGLDTGSDTDGDGLTAIQEYQRGGAPNMEDTDGDGYWDLVEYRAGTSLSDATKFPPAPVNGDLDRSGRANAVDVQIVINNALGRRTPAPGDVNGDHVTNAADVQLVINFVLAQP